MNNSIINRANIASMGTIADYMQGELVETNLENELNKLSVDDEFVFPENELKLPCTITGCEIEVAGVTEIGTVYEYSALDKWLSIKSLDPESRICIQKENIKLIPISNDSDRRRVIAMAREIKQNYISRTTKFSKFIRETVCDDDIIIKTRPIARKLNSSRHSAEYREFLCATLANNDSGFDDIISKNKLSHEYGLVSFQLYYNDKVVYQESMNNKNFNNCRFDRGQLRCTTFNNCTFDNCTFVSSTISCCNFNNCTFYGSKVTFYKCFMSRASFTNVKMNHMDTDKVITSNEDIIQELKIRLGSYTPNINVKDGAVFIEYFPRE
jgi:uncharacterized protein YjbI with pentapeptide repeats